MIVEAILNVFSTLIQFLLGLLPNIPQMPSDITAGLSYITNIITGTVSLVAYLESTVILVFAFTAILVILNFDNVYKLTKWFYHLVRG